MTASNATSHKVSAEAGCSDEEDDDIDDEVASTTSRKSQAEEGRRCCCHVFPGAHYLDHV